jgi:hypothetical protein
MSSEDNPIHHCVMCNKTGTLRCSRCERQWFCGKQCQKEDWPVHKLLCGQRKSFESRPTGDSRRAILFSESQPTVEFIWVALEYDPKDEEYFGHPKLEAYHGDTGSTLSLNYNVVRNRHLHGHLDIRHRDTLLTDGSKLNQGIIMVTKGKAEHTWAGPIIAMKYSPEDYVDIDMGDFRDVVDYFVPCNPTAPKSQRVVKAVRINCLGDVTKSGRRKFEAVDLPVNRTGKYPMPPLSKQVGMPLELVKVSPPGSWGNDSCLLQNQAVTFLYLDIDPKSCSWGWAPLYWQDSVGSVIVARADGEDLHPFRVAALCHFCQYVLQPMFEDSIGGGMDPENPISKEEVMHRMSPKSFELFCAGWQSYGEK